MASDDGGPTTWGSQPGGPQTANGASFQPQTTSQQQYNQVGSGGPGNYRIAGADPVTSSASGGKGYPTYPNQPYQNSPAGTTPTTTGTPAPGYPTPQQNTSQGMYPQQQQQFGQQNFRVANQQGNTFSQGFQQPQSQQQGQQYPQSQYAQAGQSQPAQANFQPQMVQPTFSPGNSFQGQQGQGAPQVVQPQVTQVQPQVQPGNFTAYGATVATTGKGVDGKWHVVFESDSNKRLQQIYKSTVYPDKIVSDAISSKDKGIDDLFFVDGQWVVIISTYHHRPFRQAIRCRDNWKEMASELQSLGKECWRFSSITWGTGDWVAILTRPYKNAKPVCWFGGAFPRAKAFVLDRYVQGFYLDYAGYVHSEEEYFLSMTLDPPLAAQQKLFFTQQYAMDSPEILNVWKTSGLMQITGGIDGWVVASSDLPNAARNLVCQKEWPAQATAEHIEKGLWVRCLRYVP